MALYELTPEMEAILKRQIWDVMSDPNAHPIEIAAVAHNLRACGLTQKAKELEQLAERRQRELDRK